MKPCLLVFAFISLLLTSCKDKKDPEPVVSVEPVKIPDYDKNGLRTWEDTISVINYFTLIDTAYGYSSFPDIDLIKRDSISRVKVSYFVNEELFESPTRGPWRLTDTSWRFYSSLPRDFQFKDNDRLRAMIDVTGTILARSCLFKQKVVKYDIYELNFGMDKNEVINREISRNQNYNKRHI